MAETPDTDKLAKRDADGDAPARDPITSHSTSNLLLICALLLTGVLVWALYDEVSGRRPWKGYQQSYAKRMDRYLARLQKRGFNSETEVKASDEYKRLDAEAKAAREESRPKSAEIDKKVAFIDAQLDKISEEFQNRRGRITLASYNVEVAGEKNKESMRRDLERIKAQKSSVKVPADDTGKNWKDEQQDFDQLQTRYVSLKDEKGKLLAEKGEVLKPASDLEKHRDEYLKNNVTEVTAQQVRLTRDGLKSFDYGMKQINVNGDQIVDRCESCHLGVRSPIPIRAADMMPTQRARRPDSFARAFVSHPDPELLKTHDPERFGCSSCHWGNGRATTDIEKAHGENKFWLHPLFSKENAEAGCNQCHSNDRVLQGANKLTEGKDLFYQRGCVGCHRYEGYDRETDALANTRNLVKQLEDEITANEHEAKVSRAESSANGVSDTRAQELLARAESLVVTNSQLEAKVDQLNTQSRYLMQDQKKVGPNLKDVRLKLRKEWIPEWLKDPQAFRPGTKMPTFWYISGKQQDDKNRFNIVPVSQQDDERKAIAAYLWQSAFDGRVPTQQPGDKVKGEEMFKTRGCLACHSIGENEQKIGGEFAANLTRVGQKENYDYLVRWIHNPRQRWAPYCPKEKRDLTPEDYKKNGKEFVFDTARHSRCPNDGAELQVQNMTVMPNFRLSEQDSRDIATYLVSLSQPATYADAAYIDDPALARKGQTLIKQYGCAGCHEMRGFEEEQRIGKELTAEGSTPLERLDFARLTHMAENGEDPLAGHGGAADSDSSSSGSSNTNTNASSAKKAKEKPWYNHKGFFEHKLAEPGIYDFEKEKDPREHLRMPKPFLKEEWRTALTTFLLGSVGEEGANVPASLFYNPTDQQKAIQDGWWVVKKYNCMGCHNVQVGQKSVLSGLTQYQQGGTLGDLQLGPEQLPPGLMTEGARVDPEWLLQFLCDPSLSNGAEQCRSLRGGQTAANSPGASQPEANNGRGSTANRQSGPGGGGQTAQAGEAQTQQGVLPPQPGENRNGVRTYLRVRMPTFTFSPNELRTLMRFFLAVSAQQEPYIKDPSANEPLSDDERNLARSLFTSQAAPCLKCHMTGDQTHDLTATAPNFLQAGQRLKPDWTFRWLLDPQRIMPGTAMPSELFKRDGERWIFNGPLPPTAANYNGDHARLLVRYLLSLTPEEQARARSTSPAQAPAPSGSPPPAPVASHSPDATARPPSASANRQSVSRAAPRRARKVQVSWRSNAKSRRLRERWRQSAYIRRRARDFSP
ncbi:MAG: c-type cytochrome [Pyrinomonadaceae bacterium]